MQKPEMVMPTFGDVIDPKLLSALRGTLPSKPLEQHEEIEQATKAKRRKKRDRNGK